MSDADLPLIDEDLVARLVRDQFPEWADHEVRRVPEDGHDNRTFRLGEDMSVRVPSAPCYVQHMATEFDWLPRLAPQLPLPIPEPLAMGRPGHGLPWGWLVNRWLEGENATPGAIHDLTRFATDLARFQNALRAADTRGAPGPGTGNFFRGGDLMVYDGEARRCAEELRDRLDAARVIDVWEAALDSSWRDEPVWVHGDVSVGNMLVRDGRLKAVIDFGQMAAGDPACDLTIAWTLFESESRAAFERDVCLDRETWCRARGWGIWKAMLQALEFARDRPQESAQALRVARGIVEESTGR